jgi:hypothetical protein
MRLTSPLAASLRIETDNGQAFSSNFGTEPPAVLGTAAEPNGSCVVADCPMKNAKTLTYAATNCNRMPVHLFLTFRESNESPVVFDRFGPPAPVCPSKSV